jgi:hypothetical protein
LVKDSILRINFDPKNLSQKDPLQEMSSARDFKIVTQNNPIDRIKSGVNSGKFICFDPVTRSLGEKVISFSDHYNLIDHLNENPSVTEVVNKDKSSNLTSPDSRKVLSFFSTNRKNSEYIKKYEGESISKLENYESFMLQRKAIFKNLISKRIRLVMPGNFQLTSGFNVEILTSGFSEKSRDSKNQDLSLNGKYLIVGAKHVITMNKHVTLIEVVTDSTVDPNNYVSSPQQTQLLQRT